MARGSQKYIEYLRRNGFAIEEADDTTVAFVWNDMTYAVVFDETFPNRLSLELQGIWRTQQQEQVAPAVAAAAMVTGVTPGIKVYVFENGGFLYASAALDLLLPDEGYFQHVFDLGLRLLPKAAMEFRGMIERLSG